MTLLRYFILAGLVSLSLMQGACGQKGELYLPAIPEAPNVLSNEQQKSVDSTAKREQTAKRTVPTETQQDQQDEQPDNP